MGTDQQQFCLRWHSYQSSLLATLPQLLDGNDLTDVTLSAGGRNLRAHKVILSACSQYFKELFKELQPFQHPVIVLPGMNFSDLCALVTFMYSGEVNIYQHQLSGLLTMADVLHIRGLSEVGSEAGNAGMDSLNPVLPATKRDPKSPTSAKRAKLSTISPSSTHLTSPQDRESAVDKRIKESAVDYALYGKRTWDQTLEGGLYTNGSLPQEVAENLVTMDTKANLSAASQYQVLTEKMVELYSQKVSVASKKTTSSDRSKAYEPTLASIGAKGGASLSHADNFLRVKTEQELSSSMPGETNSKTSKLAVEKVDSDERKAADFSPSRLFPENAVADEKTDSSPTQGLDLSQAVTSCIASAGTTTSTTITASGISVTSAAGNNNNNNNNNSPSSKCVTGATGSPVTTPSGHTKLYATCFVCGKQLSNQYNLRVHMETHQNVQYACSICSHVSRSKDALRKHVSYRHPVPVDGSNAAGGTTGSGSSAAAKREARKLKAEQLVAATTPVAAAATPATPAPSSAPTALTTTSSASNVPPMETL